MMFGIALGLLFYYALTTLVGSLAQKELRESNPEVLVFASEDPDEQVIMSGPQRDFDGWEEEDRAYWRGLSEGDVFGRIVIPDLGLDVMVIHGVRPQDLRSGPGWIDWSDLPGPTGNCGISGHRTTYGAPFRRLDELAEGDTIDLFSPYRRYRYSVVRTLVVKPQQVEVVDSTEQPTLTLTACHPLYSAQYRIVVQADLVEVRRLEQAQE
ncbi:MAG: class E sortase [Coriobacteriia bacterium]|nr:class E sortase [Coriobacteriia bacterium]